jgi:hypothetical protein
MIIHVIAEHLLLKDLEKLLIFYSVEDRALLCCGRSLCGRLLQQRSVTGFVRA